MVTYNTVLLKADVIREYLRGKRIPRLFRTLDEIKQRFNLVGSSDLFEKLTVLHDEFRQKAKAKGEDTPYTLQ